MTYPWELVAGTLPWETAAAGASLFPRIITIKRPNAEATNGAVVYQGISEAAETVIVSGLIANVEIASSGRNTATGGIPGDSPGPIKWTITLPPASVVALGSVVVQERDVIYDDYVIPSFPNGRRFQVSAFQPTALGARIDCVRLEV